MKMANNIDYLATINHYTDEGTPEFVSMRSPEHVIAQVGQRKLSYYTIIIPWPQRGISISF
jgi:hypothetical protein